MPGLNFFKMFTQTSGETNDCPLKTITFVLFIFPASLQPLETKIIAKGLLRSKVFEKSNQLYPLMCATSSIYLISVTIKAFLAVDNFCVVKGKVVLYLTVHFKFRAGDFFVFLWYPPITVSAVNQHPNIMWTIHLLTVRLQNTNESLQVSISKICVLTV